MSTLYDMELDIATRAHAKQVRHRNGEPYIEHCKRVAEPFEDDFVKSKAVMHDVIEDHPGFEAEIASRFQGHYYNTNSAIEYYRATEALQVPSKPEPKDAVSMHFSLAKHRGTKDLKIQVLDFIRLPPQSSKALTLRLKIEKPWIHRLRCPAQTGLNIFD